MEQKDVPLSVFVSNKLYGAAAAASAASVRKDGGYNGDIVLIIDNDITKAEMTQMIIEQGGTIDEKLILFNVSELLDSGARCARNDASLPCGAAHAGLMLHGKSSTGQQRLLLENPSVPSLDCSAMGQNTFCMTFHSPHVSELFENIAVKNQILAQPDPKEWTNRLLKSNMIRFANSTTVAHLEDRIGRELASSTYFNSALLLFDTAIVREVATTLVDILILYHELGGTVFQGDQGILSVYWNLLRKKYAVLPSAMAESNRVPYDFLGRGEVPFIITAKNHNRAICNQRPVQ